MKNNITIEISYKVASTADSINDAIAREIHEIETLTNCANAKRDELKKFVRDNREAIEVETIVATLRANGYSKQDVSRLLLSYGIQRKAQKKSAVSLKIQAKAQSEFDILRKKYSKAELSAIARRIYELAKQS
jgi:predicted 3-demethylubiquinone-9 3-methyltransferase (glyoxalase superfamily)